MTFECYGRSAYVGDPRGPSDFGGDGGCDLQLVREYNLLSDLTRLGSCQISIGLAPTNVAEEPVILEWHGAAELMFSARGDVDVDLGLEIVEIE